MIEVFIKYNPYKLETEITIDGEPLGDNKIREKALAPDCRLQEWIEELPKLLVEVYDEKSFKIIFRGTSLDYDDVKEVFSAAKDLTVELCHIPPDKEVAHKKDLISDIFQKIQSGPFEKLKTMEIRNAFENAQNEEFEMCIVGVMKAGKSTFINSLLGRELMPSKAEACTAIITRIKDDDALTDNFRAEAYNKKEEKIETAVAYDKNGNEVGKLTSDDMKRLENGSLTVSDMDILNGDKNVFQINISGNIPFVSSEDISLVLVDTPGPNNFRDKNHGAVQKEFLGRNQKTLILFLTTPSAGGTEDEHALLERIAECMKVGGKQSKDRFMFVVNRLDDCKPKQDDIGSILSKTGTYLNEEFKIATPQIFPVSAKIALYTRIIKNGEEIEASDKFNTLRDIEKFNMFDYYHFEKYAEKALPPSCREKINKDLEDTRNNFKGAEFSNSDEALIHTGIVSIETAIRQYVEKYAATAKITNIVHTFNGTLEKLNCIAEVENRIAEEEGYAQKLGEQINTINERINSGEEAKKFRKTVAKKVDEINKELEPRIQKILRVFEDKVVKYSDHYMANLRDEGDDAQIGKDDAERIIEELGIKVKVLEPKFQDGLDELIVNYLIDTSKALIADYKKKVSKLTEGTDLGKLLNIDIEPYNVLIDNDHELDMESYTEVKNVVVGETKKKNAKKTFFKCLTMPWRIFTEEEFVYEPIYGDREFVNLREFLEGYFTFIQKSFRKNGNDAKTHAENETKRIAERFNEEFKKLENELRSMLKKLKDCTLNRDKAKASAEKSKKNLKWLKDIKNEIEQILEI
jgi:GTPase SAR1 family protein